MNFTRVETTSVLVAPTATAIWRKRGATKQNKRGQHTPENATELTMTTSRAAVEGRALLSDMLRCATLSMLALASQASRRHVSPPLGAPHNHSRRATRTPRRAWDVDALKQSFNWAASYPSTDTQYSAHTAAQVVLNRAATQRATRSSRSNGHRYRSPMPGLARHSRGRAANGC